jgi:hypothetical protein
MKGRTVVVVADMPLLEVESYPLVPNVLARFRRTVEHDKGRGFCSPDNADRVKYGTWNCKGSEDVRN